MDALHLFFKLSVLLDKFLETNCREEEEKDEE